VCVENENPRRNPEDAFREIGDEGGLVVIPSESTVQVLNPVGSKIYSMLDGRHTREEIVRAVMEAFEVPEARAREDLAHFLSDLAARGMLAPAGAGSRSRFEEAVDE
jgi:hypothetical protein